MSMSVLSGNLAEKRIEKRKHDTLNLSNKMKVPHLKFN